MPETRLSKQEFHVMEALWSRPEASIREIQETFPEKKRPAYTTVTTVVNRLEAKGVVKRTRKVGNFYLFAAAVSRDKAQRRLIDEMMTMLGGKSQPLMAHLIKSGQLTLDDVQDAERLLKEIAAKKK